MTPPAGAAPAAQSSVKSSVPPGNAGPGSAAQNNASRNGPPSPPPRRFVSDLRGAERIEGAFSISNAQLGRTRNDKPYLRCLLGDKTGEMPGRKWSIEEAEFRRLPTDGFVWITGETQPYQGELQ